MTEKELEAADIALKSQEIDVRALLEAARKNPKENTARAEK